VCGWFELLRPCDGPRTMNDAETHISRRRRKKSFPWLHGEIGGRYTPAMHYESHQGVIDGLEARIVTIRDSL